MPRTTRQSARTPISSFYIMRVPFSPSVADVERLHAGLRAGPGRRLSLTPYRSATPPRRPLRRHLRGPCVRKIGLHVVEAIQVFRSYPMCCVHAIPASQGSRGSLKSMVDRLDRSPPGPLHLALPASPQRDSHGPRPWAPDRSSNKTSSTCGGTRQRDRAGAG